MVNKYVDIIIIGSGISGLYSAYLISKYFPKLSFIVLEKYKKKWIGGRMGVEDFYGSCIVKGAGIGRKKKDKLLLHLLKELNIKYHEFQIIQQYSKNNPPLNIANTLSFLKEKYTFQKKPITFRQFAIHHLGYETYHQFVSTIGYSDYEEEDAYDTLYNYGMEDNYKNFTGFSLNWSELILSLANKIGMNNIHFSCNVTSIQKIKESQCEFIVNINNDKLNNEKNYICNKIIIATNINTIQKLLIPYNKNLNLLYNQIHGQPFLRVYGKFSTSSIPIMKEYANKFTIVTPPLQKIIPIDINKGIYMISYSDNNSAILLNKYKENTEKNRDFFCFLIEKSLGIPLHSLKLITMRDYYWPIGTHYYEPLHGPFKDRSDFIDKAQHPDNGIIVVGEALSKNQGWSEGALDSVRKVLTKKWIISCK
jgi:hypothetical protein